MPFYCCPEIYAKHCPVLSNMYGNWNVFMDFICVDRDGICFVYMVCVLFDLLI